MDQNVRLRKLELFDWQQFKNVEITFHDRLTILTGPNASGKTTILNILSLHAKSDGNTQPNAYVNTDSIDAERVIGNVAYSNDSSSNITRPQGYIASPYSLSFDNVQNVDLFFIPAHNQPFRHQQIENLPVVPNGFNKAGVFWAANRAVQDSYHGASDFSISYHIKRALLMWNTFSSGHADAFDYKNNFTGFEQVLKKILPDELGFKKIKVVNHSEIELVCSSNSFFIETASGGIAALISLSWLIFTHTEDRTKPFTVIIDEIENHLHPGLQKNVLSNFIKAFPHISFIVSTHSPLIVNSVKESSVIILSRNENGITSRSFDVKNEAKTANEILDEVLGISSPRPIWAEKKLDKLIEKVRSQGVTQANLKSMRSELMDLGLDELLPVALMRLAEAESD